MGRRIEIELTSSGETSWKWRAAGARQPKGDIDTSLLYEGAKVGDVFKAEAEFHLDGIEITEVIAPKAKKERADLLEMKVRDWTKEELVTTQISKKNKSRDQDRTKGKRDKPERKDRAGSQSKQPKRPRPKRLSPKRKHRDALLAEMPEEHRPIVEQVLKEGLPGVREAIKKQQAEAKAAGKPEIDAAPILAIAENVVTKARSAEWRDRADAADKISSELDLRDLRSVVVAGADVARDDESKALLEKLKTTLEQRIESDHTQWIEDLQQALKEGRVVAALRLSSRPVRAGAPLPTELATDLSKQATESLTAEEPQYRWTTVLDALAFSPVRSAVNPTSKPAEPEPDLISEVRRLSDRIPQIAKLFGIDPASVPKSEKRKPAKRRPKPDNRKNARNKTERNKSGESSGRDGNRGENKGRGDNKGRGRDRKKPVINPHGGIKKGAPARPATELARMEKDAAAKAEAEAAAKAAEEAANPPAEPETQVGEESTAEKQETTKQADSPETAATSEEEQAKSKDDAKPEESGDTADKAAEDQELVES